MGIVAASCKAATQTVLGTDSEIRKGKSLDKIGYQDDLSYADIHPI